MPLNADQEYRALAKQLSDKKAELKAAEDAATMWSEPDDQGWRVGFLVYLNKAGVRQLAIKTQRPHSSLKGEFVDIGRFHTLMFGDVAGTLSTPQGLKAFAEAMEAVDTELDYKHRD
jgi:hypothetical protein